ncbi:MAG TPA: NTF2-like N-terminal transpeptidase domain-containing protein [Candidatus Humimicrobiaceae bacterium]
MSYLKSWPKVLIVLAFLVILSASAMLSVAGCRQYDNRIDAVYFFKTDPEKAVLDFMYAINNHDAQYIYTALLPDRDKRNIDKDKFVREMDEILADVKSIEINQVTYLGYENEMSKVVIDFSIKYVNGTSGDYRKYIYLLSENGKWKIVFDKTFI